MVPGQAVMRRGMPRLCNPGLSVSGTLPVLVSISDSDRSRSLRVMLARGEAQSDVADQVEHAGPPGTRFLRLAAEMLVPDGRWPGLPV